MTWLVRLVRTFNRLPRMQPRLLSLLAIVLVACTRQPPAQPSATTTTDVPAPNDPRGLAGDWTVEFRLDSVRTPGTRGWKAGSFRSTSGTLHLGDSTSGRSNVLTSTIGVSFDSLLGRPMSCYEPRPTSTVVERDSDAIRLTFTPNVADCGFGAAGTLRGDSIVGTWNETSFAGPTVMGRFRMLKAK